ncbi:hypothetical protein [Nocardioides sp. TF02-7]|uniref:hypothetical protein n=1 Tax=Nocardioides sp. TF02-7 TaxID=2917724 RepID=UPI001F0693F1|nr:hypothetical protein [Nocardioides sp. TF02-7]UMG94052.1 hypothetical protein MF408_08380 [Nocardioides sp. TF02-7]
MSEAVDESRPVRAEDAFDVGAVERWLDRGPVAEVRQFPRRRLQPDLPPADGDRAGADPAPTARGHQGEGGSRHEP